MLKYICLALAVAHLFNSDCNASHVVGGDISLKQIDTLQYEITVRMYSDCSGAGPLSSVLNVVYESVSKQQFGQVLLAQVQWLPSGAASGTAIPQSPCISSQSTSTCNGGLSWGVREHHYKGIVTLPSRATDWIFFTTYCCRNSSDNLVNSQTTNMTIYTWLDNMNVMFNSSPVFNSIPVRMYCVGRQLLYSHEATDDDGDSLVYSLVPCLNYTYTSQMAYVPGFSPTQPFWAQTPPGVQIDPMTGVISGIPTMIMKSQVAILVKEYRNGVLIGEAHREVQLAIDGLCLNYSPTFTRDTIPEIAAFGSRAVCGDSSMIVGLSHRTFVNSIAQDGSDIRVFDPFGMPNPVFSVRPLDPYAGFCDSIIIDILSPVQSGEYSVYTKVGSDGNTFISECGLENDQFDTLHIYVADSVLRISDPKSLLLACNSQDFTFKLDQNINCATVSSDVSEFKLYNTAGDTIKLDSIVGLDCDPQFPYSKRFKIWFDDFNQVKNFPLYLILEEGSDFNTVRNFCGVYMKAGDTVAAIYSRPTPAAHLGGDTVLCTGDSLVLISFSHITHSHVWTNVSGGVWSSKDSLVVNEPGRYVLTVQDTFGCRTSDTIKVSYRPYVNPPPRVMCAIGPNGEADFEWYAPWGADSFEVSLDSGFTWIAPNHHWGQNTHSHPVIPQYFSVRSLSTILCSPSKMTEVNIDCEIFVVNCITPNGDGFNDAFRIDNVGTSRRIQLQIFNSWGKSVYRSSDYKNDWDADGLSEGQYFYLLNIPGVGKKKGHVRVMR